MSEFKTTWTEEEILKYPKEFIKYFDYCIAIQRAKENKDYNFLWTAFDISTEGMNNESRSIVLDAFSKGLYHYQTHNRPVCAISGGSDSDILIDLICRLDLERKTTFVFFNTGIEMQPTKDHIKYLEKKYNITIQEEKPQKTVVAAVKEYGQPFISKQISEMLQRLQAHSFQWEDAPFETLLKKYPKCKCALKWWCNMHPPMKNGDDSTLNISRHFALKEFIIANPPTFKISNKCCDYAKKKLGHKYYKQTNADLTITGVRKAEGGVRATAYSSCFSNTKFGDAWRPIFWFSNKDKAAYNTHFNISNSDCYSKYGLQRTGCAGCPYGKNFEFELDVLKKYEPKLFKAVNNIFKESYEYTRAYYEFREKQKKEQAAQISFF